MKEYLKPDDIRKCLANTPHLIINMIFKRLSVTAGKDSLPFTIFVV